MPRRLLPLVALALAGALLAGCAEDVAPAARAGSKVEISNDDLLAEVARWAESPTLLGQLGITSTEGQGKGSYATDFVDAVLTNRLLFDLHNEEFAALGLELTDQDTARGLFQDPAANAAVADELGNTYFTRLSADLARQGLVSSTLGEDYAAWRAQALADIQVNGRYGRWDGEAGAVLAPTGPRPAPIVLTAER